VRRARLTYPGAFHHCLNRGYGRDWILFGDKNKREFLDILAETGKKLKIRILAYCLLNNHYHLVIGNSSGRMSDFFKVLNGEYGAYYRRSHGGTGYVFQGRFKSTLIQDEGYLLMAIAYVLANPVRAKRVGDFLDYPWSSAGLYFKEEARGCVDCGFVEELFGTAESLKRYVRNWQRRGNELPIVHTELGPVLAEETGVGELKERFDRRSGLEGHERKRKDDFGFESVEKICREFYSKYKVDLEKNDSGTRYEQGLRRELLVRLRDRGGLRYREISRLPEFTALRMSALSSLYRYEKSKR
jgi:REP element-mobilizing transposase RayT